MLWAQIVVLVLQVIVLILHTTESAQRGKAAELWVRVIFCLLYSVVLYLAGAFSQIVP